MMTPTPDFASPLPRRSISSERPATDERSTFRQRPLGAQVAFAPEELPLTVRTAARYLGVSIQTVYLWVERKQIPHLRVMGRNIRFLKSDLEPFRASFKQEMGNGKTE
jgi:excisionase family DNA binding protein